MRSTVDPHRIINFAVCKECFWTVTVLNSDLYQESVCPICSGVIDKIPMVEPNESKILDYISAYVNMKYLYGETENEGINSEESWSMFQQYLPHIY
jgi:hypothetical protein